jgi:hypothetical protein
MPGYIVTTASQITCTHGGKAVPATANTRVRIENMPALLETDVLMVTACPFTVPGPKPQPCVTIKWSGGTTMCKVSGKSVVVSSSIGKCYSAENVMQGFAMISTTQTKVRAN